MRDIPPRFEDLITDPSFQAWALQSDAEAVRYWEEWLARHPERAHEAAEAREIVLALEAGRQQIAPGQSLRSWENLAARLPTAPSETDASTQRFKHDRRRLAEGRERLAADRRGRMRSASRRTLAAAAAVCILLITGGLLFAGVFDYKVSYATGNDEIRRIRLRDGSSVVLNANSTLTYRRAPLPGSPREAVLEGEGYFEVRHLEGQHVPFRVRADELRLEVLGTSFNVRSRSGETEVVLERGSVRLRHGARPEAHTMKPGDLIKYAPEGKTVVLHGIDPAPYVGWANHLLIFEETSVEQIARLIEERFDLHVVITDSTLRDRTLTGEIVVREVDFLLDVMEASLGVQVRRAGDTLYLDRSP